ncbi:MAG: YidC/Oxa1 family membrane protein insertase, partial [Actinomycetota bacterium]
LRLPTPPERAALPSFISTCSPRLDATKEPDELVGFECHSPLGTGHLPKDGKLFADIVRDKSTFLGMHLGCSPQQAASKTAIRQCTAAEDAAAGGALVAYYSLVALMIGSTYYQQRQMTKQATGPQAKQMQMMGRIMPIFLGFISLSIPAGVIIYWIVSNGWTIGQQRFFLQRQQTTPDATPPTPAGGGKGKPAKPKPTGPKPKR